MQNRQFGSLFVMNTRLPVFFWIDLKIPTEENQ